MIVSTKSEDLITEQQKQRLQHFKQLTDYTLPWLHFNEVLQKTNSYETGVYIPLVRELSLGRLFYIKMQSEGSIEVVRGHQK